MYAACMHEALAYIVSSHTNQNVGVNQNINTFKDVLTYIAV